MEKPFGFSDVVASDSIKRISSFFFMYTALSMLQHSGLNGKYYLAI